MKRFMLLICLTTLSVSLVNGQQGQELGIHFSRSFFLGDVSGFNKTKVPVVNRMQFDTWNFAYGVYHRLYFNQYVNMKTSFNIGQLAGDDRLVAAGEYGSDSWQRSYRNIHFKSNIYEFTVGVEFNMTGFQPATRSYRFSPYVGAGLGLLHFNPRAKYQGRWVDLQPLGTEGQGMDNARFDANYSKLTAIIPVTLGLKYNISPVVSMGMEIAYKFTFTDYIDDVSRQYVSYDDFNTFYLSEEADMIYALSNRSVEVDPDGISAAYSQPGAERGNSDNLDRYMYIGLNLSISMDAFNSIRCPAW
ncbi:MAG: hypothetical protein HKN92_12580 [Chitinophagales bacterium]|nr:hypothetical protein [Chitinophagales bacterium]